MFHHFGPDLESISKGLNRENWKEERIRGQILLFVRDNGGLLTRCGRVWVPVAGRVM